MADREKQVTSIDRAVDRLLEQDFDQVDFGQGPGAKAVEACQDILRILEGEDLSAFGSLRAYLEMMVDELKGQTDPSAWLHAHSDWRKADDALDEVIVRFQRLEKVLKEIR